MRILYISLILLLLITTNIGCYKNNTSTDVKCEYKQEVEIVKKLADSGAIFLFGERHGTKEAPTFVADFACKIAIDTKKSVIVLLELPIPEVLSDPSRGNISIPEAKRLILEEGRSYWSKLHDGRTSSSMMEAIVYILYLREQGLDIALGSTLPKQTDSTEYLGMDISFANEYTFQNNFFKEAARILNYKNEFENVIVLNGRNHTRNHMEFFKKAKINTPYMGFVQAYGGGSEWNCQEDRCGVHTTIPAYQDLVKGAKDASLVIFEDGSNLYTGVYAFKNLSPSYPYVDEITQ